MLSETRLAEIRERAGAWPSGLGSFGLATVKDLFDHISEQDQLLVDMQTDSMAFQRGVESERRRIAEWCRRESDWMNQEVEGMADFPDGDRRRLMLLSQSGAHTSIRLILEKDYGVPEVLPPVAAREEIGRLRGVLRRILEAYGNTGVASSKVLALCREGLEGEDADAQGPHP